MEATGRPVCIVPEEGDQSSGGIGRGAFITSFLLHGLTSGKPSCWVKGPHIKVMFLSVNHNIHRPDP